MPTKTIWEHALAPTWQATFGAAPVVSWSDSVNSTRTRSWDNAFPNRKTMLSSLLANGYLLTCRYSDDLQDVVRSANVVCTGRLSSQANATFTVSWIPQYGRVPVDVLSDATLASLESKVVSKLQAKVVGHGTNLPTSLVEAKSTIGMIGDKAKKLAMALAQVRKGRFKSAALTLGLKSTPNGVSAGKSVMNNWLEYRYGWRLVVTDMGSLMETVWDTLHRPHYYKVVAMEQANSESRSSSVEQRDINSLPMLKWTANKYTRWSRTVRGGYVYKIENESVSTQQSFGILNPFVFAWEVIPYSFVVDWVANVGECLQGLNAFAGKSCVDGWICREIETKLNVYWTGVQKAPGGVYLVNAPLPTYYSGDIVERRFRRQRVGFTPAQFRLEFDLNVNRALDAIALVTQRFK